jgi:transposase/transposase-like protein
MDERKIKVLQLYALGVPIRRIARILGIPKSTVERWVKSPLTLKAEEKRKDALLQDEIWDRVIELLKLSNEEKGRTRVLSVSQIYRLFEMELQMRGIKSERTFRRRLEEVIKERFGSWEKLELSRRNKDEIAEYRKPKKKQRRQPAEWEIDATAYSHKNEMFFILAARERWSGYFLSCMIAKAREDTNTLYYNKAFNSADLARFLIGLFKEYGIPSRIITDNEQFLKAALIERGLKTLDIQVVRTKPYNPSAKLIERAFRDLKALLRYYVNTHTTFEEALTSAVEVYNRSAHRFEHFNEPVIPEILHSQIEYRQVSEDELRMAFRERFERVVRNNTIVIENLRYEFILPAEERAGEIGRHRKAPTVVCYRDIENPTVLEVWDEKETRPLGIARLISQDVPALESADLREIRNRERRIERRKRKLKEELIEIEQQELQLIHQQPTTTTLTFLEFLSAEQSLQPTPQPQPQPEEEEWDSINIWLGGNSHDAR